MILIYTLLIGFLTLFSDYEALPQTGDDDTTIYYVLRHAEKAEPTADEPHDPHLSVTGYVRAAHLAKLLESEELTAIYSSDFHRTRETVTPLAADHSLDIQLYNPPALEALAEMLKSSKGRIVIAGHSNTTPELVRLLGGDPGTPIDDKTEFDRLYILYVSSKNQVTTILLRYDG